MNDGQLALTGGQAGSPLGFEVRPGDARDRLRALASTLGASPPEDASDQSLVGAILGKLVRICEEAEADDARARVLRGHLSYHRENIGRETDTELADFAGGFRLRDPASSNPEVVRVCVSELLQHLAAAYDQPLALISPPSGPTQADLENPLAGLIPRSIFGLRTEAAFNLIAPWFMKSLEVPGDVCEFGCFKGTMSIKFAAALRSLGADKIVYAFDTFEGFQIDDPSGGQLTVGYYAENDNAYDELLRWSKLLPLRPVKGDAAQTCKILDRKLSFVWMDIDFAHFMRPVLDEIWPLLQPDTIIGVDDVGRIDSAGRLVTPSVEPWVDELVQTGRLTELARYPGAFIRFYRPIVGA